MKFLIAIENGSDDTAFGVVVPDVPGCFSAGDTLEEAFANAVEAIEQHVALMIEDGAELPVVADPGRHMADPEYAGMAWGFVDVPVEKHFGPAERINITVPARFLEKMDAVAKAVGESRSGFIVRAARAYMAAIGAPRAKKPARKGRPPLKAAKKSAVPPERRAAR